MSEAANGKSTYARIVTHPLFHIVIAVLLMVTSGWEIVEDYLETMEKAESHAPGGHHGLFVFALANILHRVAEMMEGAAMLHKVKEHEA